MNALAPQGAAASTEGRALSARVLLIEDDLAIAQIICDGLADHEHVVYHAGSGAEAHRLLDAVSPDVIILDLLLPDADGLTLCGDLRARTAAPIIVCSALPPHPLAVQSLRLGADDFISKPFRLDELEARVAASLRRERRLLSLLPSGEQARGPDAQRVGALVVDHRQHQILVAGAPVTATPTEYRLVAALTAAAGRALSRAEIGMAVWGYYDAAIGRAIDVHVTRLRAKLAQAREGPLVEVVRGYGFRLVEHATAEEERAS